MKAGPLNRWLDNLIPLLEQRLQENPHGDLQRWQEALKQLPDISPDQIELNSPAILANIKSGLSEEDSAQLKEALLTLKPWRKGPFQIFDTSVCSHLQCLET